MTARISAASVPVTGLSDAAAATGSSNPASRTSRTAVPAKRTVVPAKGGTPFRNLASPVRKVFPFGIHLLHAHVWSPPSRGRLLGPSYLDFLDLPAFLPARHPPTAPFGRAAPARGGRAPPSPCAHTALNCREKLRCRTAAPPPACR